MITDGKRQINICPIYFVTDKINTVIKFKIIQKQIQDANKHWRLYLKYCYDKQICPWLLNL